jgi:HK97 gp10 family phage protein
VARISATIEGVDELRRTLQRLEDKTQKQVLRQSTAKGAQVVAKSAKQNARAISANVASAVGVRKLKPRNRFESAHSVNILSSRARPVTRTFDAGTEWGKRLARAGYALIATFFEFGTSKMPRRPLLGDAYERTKNEAQAAIEKGLLEGIDKAAKEEGVRR